MDEEEDEDEDEDNGKEPRTIDQGEMVNTSADETDTMVDNQPTMLPDQGQEMHEHIPRPQTQEPRTQHTLRSLIPAVGWSFWGL